MEDKLKSWKSDLMEGTEEDDDPDDPAEPVQAVKLSPTQLLKQQLMQADVLADTGASGIRLRISRGRAVSDLGMTAFEKECLMYEKLPDVQQDADLLGWWRNHQEQFPLLSYIVRYFLLLHDLTLSYFLFSRVVFAVPAASSKSERVFSVAGNCVKPARSRLSPETVENLVIMKSNLALLKEFGVRK